MYIIDGPKPFGIICHPKTGSQSTRVALQSVHRARVVRGQHLFDIDECVKIKEKGILACFVRNPFDTMVSWYHYIHDNRPYNGNYPQRPPFDEWLPVFLERGNGWIERGLFYGAYICNRVLRFENGVETQLNKCLIECGLQPVELGWNGKSKRRPYSVYYTPELRRMIEEHFAEELTTYDYSFGDYQCIT